MKARAGPGGGGGPPGEGHRKGGGGGESPLSWQLDDTSESNQTLWLLAASPLFWAAHFMACYLTGAIWCAKAVAPSGPLDGVRIAVGAYTVAALAGIALVGWLGYRRHKHGTAAVPHDFDTPEDRHRFLGFAALLLSGLSAVAVLYVAATALYFRTCL